MTLESQIVEIEDELNKLIRDGETGTKTIMFGDIDKGALRYPAVHFLLQDATQNDLQVIQPNKIGWDLTYEVSCVFAGTDARNTIISTRAFTNSIYDLIQGQRTVGKMLGNNAFDLNCDKIDYVTFETPSKNYVYGGIITVIIQIFETR